MSESPARPARRRGDVLHLAAGFVFSVVAVELLPEIQRRALAGQIAVGFAPGTPARLVVNALLEQRRLGVAVGVAVRAHRECAPAHFTTCARRCMRSLTAAADTLALTVWLGAVSRRRSCDAANRDGCAASESRHVDAPASREAAAAEAARGTVPNMIRPQRPRVWPPVIGLVSLIAAAALTSSYGKRAQRRSHRQESHGESIAPALRPVMVSPADTVIDGDLFDTPDLIPTVGRRVRVPAATVQSAVGRGLVWVGRSLSQRMLVRLPAASARASPGQTVGVTGTLRRMPARLDDWRARFDIPDAAMHALREAHVYLETDGVRTVGP